MSSTSEFQELSIPSRLHTWEETLGINANALFPLLIKTLSGIENWKIETASPSRGVVLIIPAIGKELPDNVQGERALFCAILLVISYQNDNLSSLGLRVYSREPIERKVAENTIPVTRIFELSGEGRKLRLRTPMYKTLNWHIGHKSLKLSDDFANHLKDLLGAGADLLISDIALQDKQTDVKYAELPVEPERAYSRLDTDNISFREVEENMRPGRISTEGFLGPNEDLKDILREDEETVKKLGVPHQIIAERLEELIKLGLRRGKIWLENEKNKTINKSNAEELPTLIVPLPEDNECSVTLWYHHGFAQECPWGDLKSKEDFKYAGFDIEIVNKKSQEKILASTLLVHLIRIHHFYEGKGSPYRIDPHTLVRVLKPRI